jgi:uncharacterized protein YbaP (TraB family)
MKILKYISLLAFFALMIFVLKKVYEEPQNELPQVEVKETGNLFMWEAVSDKGNVVTLLGSIHAAKKSLYPLDPAITKAYEDASNIVFELDPTDLKLSFTDQMQLARKGTFPLGITCESILTKKEISAVKKSLPIYAPYSLIKTLKPWALSMILQYCEFSKLGYDSDQGIDMHFIKKAKKDKKTILALETTTQQLAVMMGGEEEHELKNLKLTLKNIHQLKGLIEQAFIIWNSGDHEALYQASVTEVIKKHPYMKHNLKRYNSDRNITMCTKIEGYINSNQRHMVVVGALHLSGKEGVIALLKSKGYKITQVKQSDQPLPPPPSHP